MFCPNCGKEQQGNPRFCRSCGTRLGQAQGNQVVQVIDAEPEIMVQEELAGEVWIRINDGKNKKKIVKELVKKGWHKEAVIAAVDGMEQAIEEYKKSPEGRREMASQYKRTMLYGFFWFIGGLAVTIGTYMAAIEGGFFFVFWGAVLFGLIDIIRGFFGWLKYSG